MSATTAEPFDSFMMGWKKLASWNKPTHSFSALLCVNLACAYLKFTDSTTLNLACYAVLMVYAYKLASQSIIPDLRNMVGWGKETNDSEEEEAHSTSMSEVSFMIEETRSYYGILRKFRSDSPTLFGVLMSAFFSILIVIGPYFALLPCIYLTLNGGLLLPLAMKKLKEEYPWIADMSEKMRNMLVVILQDLLEKAKVQAEKIRVQMAEKRQLAVTAVEAYATKVKTSIDRYTSRSKAEENIKENEKNADLAELKDVNGNVEEKEI